MRAPTLRRPPNQFTLPTRAHTDERRPTNTNAHSFSLSHLNLHLALRQAALERSGEPAERRRLTAIGRAPQATGCCGAAQQTEEPVEAPLGARPNEAGEAGNNELGDGSSSVSASGRRRAERLSSSSRLRPGARSTLARAVWRRRRSKRQQLLLLALAVCLSLHFAVVGAAAAASSQDSERSANSFILDERQPRASTVSDFFLRVKSSFSSKSTTQLPTTTTTTTTQEPTTTTTTSEQDEPGAGHDDDDAQGCASLPADEPAEAKNLTDNERLVQLQTWLQRKMRRFGMNSARGGMEMYEKLALSGACSRSLMDLAISVGSIKSFAFKFLDASAKLPSGVMYGLLSDFGDFDQCLSIRSNPSVAYEDELEERAYSGKYCLVSIKPNYRAHLEPNSSVPEGIQEDGVLWDEMVRHYWTSNSSKGFQMGVCLPSRCSNDDLEQLYNYMATKYNFVGRIMSCQDSADLKSQTSPDFTQRLISYAFYTLMALTLAGTIVDRYCSRLAKSSLTADFGRTQEEEEESKGLELNECSMLAFRLLICFSLTRNWRTFSRLDGAASNQWDTLSSSVRSSMTASSSPRAATLNRTSTDDSFRISITSGSSEASEPSKDKGALAAPPVDCKDKLGQLTVRVQPDDEHFVQLRNELDDSANQQVNLRHLAGLRMLVIIWITIGHSFLYPSANNYQYYRSIINMNITKDSVWFATTNFTLGFDTLLYITGLCFVYKLFKSTSRLIHAQDAPSSPKFSLQFKAKRAGLVRLISHKVLRFWPTYMSVMGLAIVVPLLSDGPMWPEMVGKRIGASCRHNWWANLLFVNNFLAESEICLPSSWFVSILMQLFLVGAILLYIVQKCSLTLGLAALSSLLVSSCALSFTFAYLANVRAPIIRMDESFVMELDDNIFRLYTNIFNNMGPFLIGMAGGFLLLSAQARSRQLRLKQQLLGSSGRQSPQVGAARSLASYKPAIVRFLVGLFVLIVAFLVLSSVFYQHYSRFWAALYWSLHRVGWALVTGYVIHNCATNSWPLLNDLLSMPLFLPLNRLIPIAYLVYPIFIHMHSGLVRDGLHVSIYNMLNIYTTRLVMTFATALLLHLLVELPFCSIEQLYLNRCWIRKNMGAIAKSVMPFGGQQNQSSFAEGKRDNSLKFHPLLRVAAPNVVEVQNNNLTKESGEDLLCEGERVELSDAYDNAVNKA